MGERGGILSLFPVKKPILGMIHLKGESDTEIFEKAPVPKAVLLNVILRELPRSGKDPGLCGAGESSCALWRELSECGCHGI